MSVEHQPRPSDQHERASAELAAAAKERLEQLSSQPENAPEQAERRVEAARQQIERHTAEPAATTAEQATPAAPHRLAAHLDHVLNYRQTMASVQRKLTPASRAFSKAIHLPAVEKTSEALERTVMRPSVVAGATWSAAIVGLIFYLTARFYGWPLSGSEMLIALACGALLGLAIESFGRLLRRRS